MDIWVAIEAIGWRYAPVNAKDGKSAVFAGAFLQVLLVSGKMLLGSFWIVPAYTEKFFETVIRQICLCFGLWAIVCGFMEAVHPGDLLVSESPCQGFVRRCWQTAKALLIS